MYRRLRQPHRDNYEIIKQILQTVYSKAGGYRSFELAYRCQLTWPQFIRYRDVLLSCELLIVVGKGSSQHYEITLKGERYLQVITEIEVDLRPVDTN
jgi:predicted transcriptional regulator